MDDSDRLRKRAVCIEKWLKRCLSKHRNTRCEFRQDDVMPRRLIYIGSGPSDVHLVDEVDFANPDYVVLSYAWGDPKRAKCNLTTTKANLDSRLKNIPWNDLPKTLRHAIEVAQYLQFQYLWIDALCIVQNDKADKNQEIAKMADIYVNARLEIAATSSEFADSGLLPEEETVDDAAENDNAHPNCDVQKRIRHHKVMSVCRSLAQSDWNGLLRLDYHLLTRGWAFQERMLARRCVHFTSIELVWECRCERYCRCGLMADDVPTTSFVNNLNAALEACMSLKNTVPDKHIPLWRECVTSYSRRGLTRPEDILTAISAIAKKLRGSSGDENYLAGLRKEAMPFDLLWRRDQTTPLASRNDRQPTWSWCSITGGVNWPTARSDPATGASKTPSQTRSQLQILLHYIFSVALFLCFKCFGIGRQQTLPNRTRSQFEASLDYIVSGAYFEPGLTGVSVLSAEVYPQRHDYDLPRFGVVVLLARSVLVTIRKHTKPKGWWREHQTEWVIEGEDGAILPFYPDRQVEKRRFMFIEVASVEEKGKIWEAGLVVEDDSEGLKSCKRAGMAGYTDCTPREASTGWFDNAAYRPITLT